MHIDEQGWGKCMVYSKTWRRISLIWDGAVSVEERCSGCKHPGRGSYSRHFLHTLNVHVPSRGRLCHPSDPHPGKVLPLSLDSRTGVPDVAMPCQPHTSTEDFTLSLQELVPVSWGVEVH